MIDREHFSGQQTGEEIQIFLRKHQITLVWSLRHVIFVLLVSVLVLLGVWTWLPRFFGSLLLGFGVLLIPMALFGGWQYLVWYYDIFVVTNRRLLDFARKPLIYEKRDEAQLSRVQDIKVEFPGPIPVLLDYGNVNIQTAGTKGQIVFTLVPHPRDVQAQILQLVTAAQQRGGLAGGERPEVVEMRQFLGILLPDLPAATPSVTPPTQASWRSRLRAVFRPILDLKETDRVWRKHWWRLLEATSVSGTVANLGLVMGVLMIWWRGLGPELILPLIILVVGNIWNLWNIIDWQNDLYILTDDRIIDIEKVPLISEDRREARLQQIQDVHYIQPGFLYRVLDFGNVEVETAGRGGGFTFNSVPHPKAVQAEIFERIEAMRKNTGTVDRQKQEGDLLSVLYKYRQASSPPVPGP